MKITFCNGHTNLDLQNNYDNTNLLKEKALATKWKNQFISLHVNFLTHINRGETLLKMLGAKWAP